MTYFLEQAVRRLLARMLIADGPSVQAKLDLLRSSPIDRSLQENTGSTKLTLNGDRYAYSPEAKSGHQTFRSCLERSLRPAKPFAWDYQIHSPIRKLSLYGAQRAGPTGKGPRLSTEQERDRSDD